MSPTTETTHTVRGDDGPSFWDSLAIIMVVSLLLCFWRRRMTHRAPLSPSRAQAQREFEERFDRALEEGLHRLLTAQREEADRLARLEEEADRLARAALEEEADRLVGAQAVEEEEVNEHTTMTFRELWEGVRSGEIPMESLAQYTLVER